MQIHKRHQLLMLKINDIMHDIDVIESQLEDPDTKKLTAARKHLWLAGCILQGRTKDDKGAIEY